MVDDAVIQRRIHSLSIFNFFFEKLLTTIGFVLNFIARFWGQSEKPLPFELKKSRVGDDFCLLGKRWRAFGQAHVAQLAEHILGKDEVTSSILVMGSGNIFLRLVF